jgi:hypothetical protein
MATRLAGRIPVDRVSAEARQVDLGRALLTLLVGCFWLVGWLVGKATLGIAFVWAAAKVGYADARGEAGRPPRAGPA